MRKLLLHLTVWPTRRFGSASIFTILSIGLLLSPLSVSSLASFSLSAGVDGVVRDQEITAVEVSPEETVSSQVFATDVGQAQGRSLADPAKRPLWGALAIDSNQGPSWGWAIRLSDGSRGGTAGAGEEVGYRALCAFGVARVDSGRKMRKGDRRCGT